MNHLTTLALAGALAGCSAHAPEPAPAQTGAPSPAEPTTLDVDANLARLRGLSIFEVLGVPEEANCYAGDAACIARARAQAAPGVAAFTDAAVRAAALPPATYGVTDAANDANLRAIRALNVVTVGMLIVEQPRNNPNCYNLPCPEDRAAADAVNRGRAGQLANIARSVAK